MFLNNVCSPEIIQVSRHDESGAVSVLGLSGVEQVPVCYEGNFGNWSSVEANVICRDNGYLEGEAIVLTEEDIGYTPTVVVLDFTCDGSKFSTVPLYRTLGETFLANILKAHCINNIQYLKA